MIHQLIFANPKPGMSPADFQNYWLNVHAVRYASKIRQVVRYCIDLPPLDFGETPPFWGVAEIWLESEAAQLASLQSPEYIDGARRDEPNWAAFWGTVGLATTAYESLAPERDDGSPKTILLHKRREGLPLAAFRKAYLGARADRLRSAPEVTGLTSCIVRDGAYAVGESSFDAVTLLRLADVSKLHALAEDCEAIMESKYELRVVTRERWVIGPEFRPSE